jgi:tRNA A-37 threonylcarbamoyl transferase component Bud32
VSGGLSLADDDSEILPAGTTLGRYEIVRLIGRGGMGAVYEGTHLDLKKRVAIKTLRPSVAAQAGARARFLREGEAASRIQHRNVVDVTDVGTAAGVTYLVMELLEGQDLADRLSSVGALPVAETMDVMLPVLAAIAVAHDAGVIHRDLKPENIFLARTRHSGLEPKVLDFGISKISSSGSGRTLALTGTGASMGTPYYMAPEQVRSAATVDARSDQYALGAIVYQCVTGRRAHEGESIYEVIRSVGDGAFRPPRELRPDLPSALDQAILRAMRLEPAQRFPDVRAFAHALLPFAAAEARVRWAPELRSDQLDPAAGAPETAAPIPGGTVLLPPATPPRAPAPRRPAPTPDTTFGASAAEITVGAPRRRSTPLVTALVLLAAGAVATYAFFSPGRRPDVRPPASTRAVDVPRPSLDLPPPARPEPPARYHVSVSARPHVARFELDGRPLGSGSFSADLPADGNEHTLAVTADGFVPARLTFRDRPPPGEVKLQPVVADVPAGGPAVLERPVRAAAPARLPGHRARVRAQASGSPQPAPQPELAPPPPPKRSGPIRTENNAAIIDD